MSKVDDKYENGEEKQKEEEEEEEEEEETEYASVRKVPTDSEIYLSDDDFD